MDKGLETTKSGKEILHDLESEGGFVFHGSPRTDLEVLEPRQGTQVADLSNLTEMVNDGEPAVSATPYADFAIFRAILNSENLSIPHTTGFGIVDGKKSYSLSSFDILENAQNKRGYVYVFNKDDFTPYDRKAELRPDSMEWRSYKQVRPVMVVPVNSSDLPDKSEIKLI